MISKNKTSGLYLTTNLPKRGVAILKIPAEAYASPMAIDYSIGR